MTQKINDTNARISIGGRLRNYWDEHGIKQRRSSFVQWDNKDIDLKALIQEYKLYGFEFGRYVNNEDRYDFVLATKDSLRDLAWMLKTDNLGVDYKIGIAFGARGKGGNAKAHYEPMLNMINLTKNKGEHSLAHEYGHAIDYTIGTYIDQNKDFCFLSGGRSMARFPENNTGGTCRLLMRKLIRDIKATPSFDRLKKASDYWHYNTEVFARFFEQWCCYKLRQAHQSNAFLTKVWTHYTERPQYLTEADFKKVLPTADKLMKNIGLLLDGKKVEPYMELEVVNPEKVKKAMPKAAATKKEPAKKETAPKAAPKKAVKKAAVASKTVKADKLAYQDYDKAFEALKKFAGKDPSQTRLACVYHDDGNMVATDAHILAVIHKAKYPKAKEHKMVLANDLKITKDKTEHAGQIIEGRYPNWKAVIPTSKNSKPDKGTVLVVDDELAKAKAHLAKQRKLKAEYNALKKKHGWSHHEFAERNGLSVYGNTVSLSYPFRKFTVKVEALITCLDFMKAAGAKTVFYQDIEKPTSRAGVFRSGNLEALIMPVMTNN